MEGYLEVGRLVAECRARIAQLVVLSTNNRSYPWAMWSRGRGMYQWQALHRLRSFWVPALRLVHTSEGPHQHGNAASLRLLDFVHFRKSLISAFSNDCCGQVQSDWHFRGIWCARRNVTRFCATANLLDLQRILCEAVVQDEVHLVFLFPNAPPKIWTTLPRYVSKRVPRGHAVTAQVSAG